MVWSLLMTGTSGVATFLARLRVPDGIAWLDGTIMKIFLGYPSERLSQAREIYDFLTSVDLDVWFDRENIVAGQDWEREIAKAQDAADLAIHVCSQETVSKTGVLQSELRETLELLRRRPLDSLYLICIKADDVALPRELLKYHYIDFADQTWRDQLKRSLMLKHEELGAEPPIALATYNTAPASSTTQPTLLRLHDDNPQWSLSATYLKYPEINDYWRYINAEIVRAVFSHVYAARRVFQNPVLHRKMEVSFQLEEVFAMNDLVSLKLFHYTDYAGAHAGMGTETKNFFGPNAGRIGIQGLFARNFNALASITEYVMHDLHRQAGKDLNEPMDGCLVERLELILSEGRWPDKVAMWDLYAEYTFDRASITFHFSPGQIYNYWASGDHTVRMPWDTLISFFHPTLRELLGPVFSRP
jgi:hypothetical protein